MVPANANHHLQYNHCVNLNWEIQVRCFSGTQVIEGVHALFEEDKFGSSLSKSNLDKFVKVCHDLYNDFFVQDF